LMPENMKALASINAGDMAKLCLNEQCDIVYRMKVRGLLTKLPGFTAFSSYKSTVGGHQMVTSNK